MPLFVMIGWDGPDGVDLRKQHHDSHVSHILELDRQGKIPFAGPIKSDSCDKSIGAVIVLEATDVQEARELIDRDPYVLAGVFKSVSVNCFKQFLPNTS